MNGFSCTQSDEHMIQRLQDFLPDRIFDAHAHVFYSGYLPSGSGLCNRYGTTDAARFLEDQKLFYGNKSVSGLLIPYPVAALREKELRLEVNRWMAGQLDSAPQCGCEIFVAPSDTADEIAAQLTHPGIKGFKCYHLSADESVKVGNADICQYLPESAWEVAQEYGLCITVHLVKPLSLIDPVNMSYIKSHAGRYPNAKLILAHCGRGFASYTAMEGVRQLREYQNIYYDLAAVTDPAVMFEVIRQAGINHVLWGSDYPIDRAHGRTVNCGETFAWLFNSLELEKSGFAANYVGLESLFAFYQACLMLDMPQSGKEAIFCDNAKNLLNMDG